MFPNVHKELILGIPWLAAENPDIDWTTGKVTVQKNKTIVNLLLVPEETQGPMDVNQCTAKQMQRWVRKGSIQDLFLGFIRRMDDEENSTEVEEKETEEEKAFHAGMPEIIREVLRQHAKVFSKDLPKGLPPMQMGREFKIDLEDETPPIHKPLYKLSPVEL